MKFKKNGFTLIEIIATISIMILLVTIVTSNILGISNAKMEKQYNEYINYFISAAKNYVKEYKTSVISTIKSNGKYVLTLETLYDKNYIDTIPKNPITKQEFEKNSCIIIEDNSGLKYTYSDECE